VTTRLPLVGQHHTEVALEVAPQDERAACHRPTIFVLHGDGDAASVASASQLADDAQRLGVSVRRVVPDHISLHAGHGPWTPLDPRRPEDWRPKLNAKADIFVGAGHQLPGWLRPSLTLLFAPQSNPASWAASTRAVRDRVDILLTSYRPAYIQDLLRQLTG